ncbi:MAG: hypothetical protein L6425_11625 [Candidatus Aminicenantes bacterium]|nr:hypothetical protein [Candidatus Aminicenantes bacterium]
MKEWTGLQVLHQLIDCPPGLTLSLGREMSILRRCFWGGMAQVDLDESQMNSRFQEMGSIRMAQGLGMDPFFDSQVTHNDS